MGENQTDCFSSKGKELKNLQKFLHNICWLRKPKRDNPKIIFKSEKIFQISIFFELFLQILVGKFVKSKKKLLQVLIKLLDPQIIFLRITK